VGVSAEEYKYVSARDKKALLDGKDTFERIAILREDAVGWNVPRFYPNRTIRKKYIENNYPTHMTLELLKSSEFAIPRPFDPTDQIHMSELFCELFPGSFLLNCVYLEQAIYENKTPGELSEECEVPEDNVKIRLAQYYLLRFGEREMQNHLRGIEKLGFELYLEAVDSLPADKNSEIVI